MVFTSNKQFHYDTFHGKTMEQIKEEYSKDPHKKYDERLGIILYKYRDVLDASYHLLLSKSNDLEKLFQFAPDFFVIEDYKDTPDIASLLDIDETILWDLLERNRHFVNFNSSWVVLNRHFRDFLSDRNRSRGYYHNLRPHRLSLCLRFYKLIFDHPWLDNENPYVFCICDL